MSKWDDPHAYAQQRGAPDAPVYTKFKQDEPAATQFWGINVDEGWRSWILCTDMYEWAADDLLRRLRAAPAERWPHA